VARVGNPWSHKLAAEAHVMIGELGHSQLETTIAVVKMTTS
jgi:hypothetical protein